VAEKAGPPGSAQGASLAEKGQSALDGSSLTWALLGASLFLCLLVSLSGAALRRFSWAVFEGMNLARRRRLAVAYCLDHSQGLEMFLGLVATIAATVLGLSTAALMLHESGTPTGRNAAALMATALLLSSAGLIVVAWLVPASVAQRRAEKVLVRLAPALETLARVGTWLRDALERQEHEPPARETAAGLPALAAMDEPRAHEEEEAQEVLRTIQRIRTVDVSEIMTPRIDMVSVDSISSLEEARRLALEHGHSRLPVFERNRDHIVGVLYVKDLLKYLDPEAWRATKIADVMRKPYFIPETKSVADLLEEFQRRKVHMAVVLDEYGGTAGIVTIEDIIEEIVGEIQDEYDAEEPAPVKHLDEHTAEVDAKIHVDVLNDAMNIDLPESDDYETLAGFITAALGRIPKKGELLEHDGVLLTVLEADVRKIHRVRVEIANQRKER